MGGITQHKSATFPIPFQIDYNSTIVNETGYSRVQRCLLVSDFRTMNTGEFCREKKRKAKWNSIAHLK